VQRYDEKRVFKTGVKAEADYLRERILTAPKMKFDDQNKTKSRDRNRVGRNSSCRKATNHGIEKNAGTFWKNGQSREGEKWHEKKLASK